MTLNITAQHIRTATYHRQTGTYDVCKECVVAQAIHDIPSWHDANVNNTCAWIADEDWNVVKQVNFPPALQEYIHAFDARQPIEPATFELDL